MESKDIHSAFKKGKRLGIKIVLATANQWKKYYKVYLETFNRWTNKPSSPYGWHLFEKISELDTKKSKLWLALFEEKIIAGCLCFYHNEHVVYWHGASLKEYQTMRPVHLLQYHIHQKCHGK